MASRATAKTAKKKSATKTAKAPVEAKPKAKMGRPLEMRGPIGELAEALGGRRALANTVGVAERSISRWETGEVLPPRPTRLLLAQLSLANGIEPPYETGAQCPRPAWLDEEDDDGD